MMGMAILTPCGLAIPRIDQLKCLEEFSMMIITHNGVVASTVYVEDRLWRTIEVQEADRVTHAQDYWLNWHDNYCDCRTLELDANRGEWAR